MNVRDFSLSGGSQRNGHPEGCIGYLKIFLQLFDLCQWCSRVHPIDVTGHILLAGSAKLIIAHNSPNEELYGAFGVGQYRTRFQRRKSIQTKNGSYDNTYYH